MAADTMLEQGSEASSREEGHVGVVALSGDIVVVAVTHPAWNAPGYKSRMHMVWLTGRNAIMPWLDHPDDETRDYHLTVFARRRPRLKPQQYEVLVVRRQFG